MARFVSLGRPKATPAEIERALAEVGAGALLQRQLSELSGGELQRAVLARALMRSPDLLVLDEPARGVDYAGEAELYTLIGRLRTERGFGVLLVSHDLHVVMAQSDRVICLNRHVCCSGVPQSVAQHPEYARLFGSQAAHAFAVYQHVHDHSHDLAGAPCPVEDGQSGVGGRRVGKAAIRRRAVDCPTPDCRSRYPTHQSPRRPTVLEPFLLRALLFGLGLAAVAAPLGCFVVWRRMAYYGEAIAQAALIGVALAFALSLDVTAGVLIVTLAVSGLLLLLGRQRVVPFDSLLGLIAHAALAAGVIFASLASGRQPDLMGFLFGDILAITDADLAWLLLGGAGAMAALVAVWRPLLSLSVNEDIAAAEGTASDRVRLVFVVVLAVVVAIAIKIVGALLTIAFLIMPAAAARPLARTPEQMALIAGVLGMLAVAAGLLLSLAWDTPAGPSIVVVLAALFAASILPSVLRR